MRLLISIFSFWILACAGTASGQTRVIHSDILNEDRTIQVMLPASYDWAPDRSYPVLFLLDGESQFGHTKGSVEFLAEQGEIPELIVVAITSTVRIRDYTQTDWSSHWIGGGGAERFRTFLSEELIPQIEVEYRANGFRILIGHSAGGQFALFSLSSQPSLFHAYIALSPSLDWDDNLPQRALAESFERTDSVPAFLYFAWSDDSGRALEDDLALAETLRTASPPDLRWVAKGYPEETHGSIPLVAQIDALRELFRGYRFRDDAFAGGLAAAEAHFADLSKTVGYSIPVPENVMNGLGYDALHDHRIQEAIEIFRRNIEQNPNSANAYDSITDAYEEAAMWAEAAASSKRAAELAATCNHPSLHYFVEHAANAAERYALESGNSNSR